MYIMCVCLFSALSRRVDALQMSIIIITYKGGQSSCVKYTGPVSLCTSCFSPGDLSTALPPTPLTLCSSWKSGFRGVGSGVRRRGGASWTWGKREGAKRTMADRVKTKKKSATKRVLYFIL